MTENAQKHKENWKKWLLHKGEKNQCISAVYTSLPFGIYRLWLSNVKQYQTTGLVGLFCTTVSKWLKSLIEKACGEKKLLWNYIAQENQYKKGRV